MIPEEKQIQTGDTNMNKILRVVLLCGALLVACLFSLTACQEQSEQMTEQTTEAETQAHVHAFGDWTAVVKATCTDAGVDQRVCECGGRELRKTAATGHEEGDWKVSSESTCTEVGINYQACIHCHIVLKTSTTPAKGHTEGDWVVNREPTCTKSGSKQLMCTTCNGAIKSETLRKLGHTEVTVEGKAPTCTEEGLKEGKYCSVCKTTTVEQKTIAALGHTDGEAVEENRVEPTCNIDGACDLVVYCTVCKAEVSRETMVLTATGHTEEIVEAVMPTCTESGLSEGKHCSVCKEILLAQETVPALGHAKVVDQAVEATCSQTGLTEGAHCDRCEQVLIEQQTTPTLNHTEGETVEQNRVEPTCTEQGSYDKVTYCAVCGEVIRRRPMRIPATGHTMKDGECTACGHTE